MGEKAVLRCSFCNKSQHEVRKLIAGPASFICDECVYICVEIIEDKQGFEKSRVIGERQHAALMAMMAPEPEPKSKLDLMLGPDPATLPLDIAEAIDALVDAEHEQITKGRQDAGAWCEAAGVCHQARAALEAAILKHLSEAAYRPKPEAVFACPKCGTRRGWLPACAQNGCPLLGLNGEEVAHAE